MIQIGKKYWLQGRFWGFCRVSDTSQRIQGGLMQHFRKIQTIFNGSQHRYRAGTFSELSQGLRCVTRVRRTSWGFRQHFRKIQWSFSGFEKRFQGALREPSVFDNTSMIFREISAAFLTFHERYKWIQKG